MKILLIVVVCAVAASAKILPDDFPQCKRDDPELDKCVLRAVDEVKPRLLNGIPEVNVPALEPFNVPTLKLDRTAPNLRIKATLKNIKAYGGSNFKIEKLKLNLNNKYVGEVKLTIPHLMVTADYDVRGSRILTLDISGKGKFRSNFTGITAVAKGSAKPVDKDGLEYLQTDKIIMKLKIGNGQIAVDDTERPVAASSAAAFFNASPTTVLEILYPLIEESGAAICKAYFNKIFSKIPLSEVLVARVPEHNTTSDGDTIEEIAKKPVCHYSDPNVADCIKRVAEQAKTLLAHGIPSFNIQPLEPLKVPSIRLRQHNMPQGRFKYDAWLTDLTLNGLTNFTFNKLDVYPEDLKVTGNISLPRLVMFGEYVVIGEFQMLPVESTGMLAANFTECSAALNAVGAKVHKRIVIRDADVKLKCSGPLMANLKEAHSTTGEMVGSFICPREDKALGHCLRDAFNSYVPQLATGVPEYGVPPCEPLHIPTISIKQSAGPITVTSSYTDVSVRGPSKMQVKKVEVDSKKHKVVASLYIPELRMKGNYNLKGQLFMLPIEGDGIFHAKYDNIDATVTIILGRKRRFNSVDALACKSLEVKFHIGNASMKLENLFGGDGELGNAMNKFLNENWEKLSNELQAPMEKALQDVLKPLADHAFGILDADDILFA
ncbi:uncharacterized protein LOC123658936 [Melitaea cinxia]|uniref:uncharacterized protein LOC123658936 n=1 Tax=Melitaea cinxia TaxID=113334 RepID=UPI001E274B35|nr:uncharacterized protein LOC123658936 [Melitaea cinxia]